MKREINNFTSYLKNQRNYSDYTINNYYKDLIEYSLFLNEKNYRYDDMDYKKCVDYLRWLDEKKLKKTSISRKLSSLRSFYKYLVLNDKSKNNPFLLVSSPKKEKRIPKFINYENIEEIFEYPDLNTSEGQRERVILDILYSSGVRVSELVSIKLSDIDFNEKTIVICGKGNKERMVSFGDYAKEAINKYISNGRKELLGDIKSDYLIVGKNKECLTTRRIEQIIDNIIKHTSIKLNITPHVFRHTFATHLLDQGCDLIVVQELLGHTSLSSTEIYTHISNEQIRNVYLNAHPRSKRNLK